MHFPFFAIVLLMNEIVTQELTLCQFPRINAKCVLTCKTPDLKRTVSFIGQGDKLGSCDADFDKLVCSTFNDNYLISVNESAGETNLTINRLSKDENEGYWHCEYDKKQSERKKLQLYEHVTCNTTEECFTENESKVEVKVNGTIIEEKVINYRKRPKEIPEDNDTSHDGMSIVVPIIITFLVIIILATGLTLKFRRKIRKVCKCRKKDNRKPKQTELDDLEQNGDNDKINIQN